MNKVFLVGHLGANPERRGSATPVVKFNVATQDMKTTTWHKVVAFGKLADAIMQCLHKGSKVLVEGRLQNSTWEKDGVKHNTTEIVAFFVEFLDPKPTSTPAPF